MAIVSYHILNLVTRGFLTRPSLQIQMFISALIDVAGHAGNLDAAFEVLQEAGMHVGIISYSSLMGACSKVCPAESANLFRYCFCPRYLFIC